jgi:hypothetical protein
MNAKRLSASEKANLSEDTVWSGEEATRGDGGQLAWLYIPDFLQVVDAWLTEAKK